MNKRIVLFCCIITMFAVSLFGANPTVTVVGYETENGKAIAWTDGEKKVLSGLPDEVKSFSVYSGKIYAAGFTEFKDNITPCYAVDGVKQALELATDDEYRVYGYVEEILVSQGIVYARGIQGLAIPDAGPAYVPSVWGDGKNVAVNINVFDPMSQSAKSFAVYNKNIYLLMYSSDMNGGDDGYPYYVLNKKETKLSGSGAVATAITVSSGKVYVAGRYKKAGYNRACFWADGKQVDLPGGTASRATSIYVAQGKVYVSGYYYDKANKACYWENGVLKELAGGTLPGAVDDAAVLPIAVNNGKVYIAGSYYEGKNKKACYWVDGKRVDLPGGVKAVAIGVE